MLSHVQIRFKNCLQKKGRVKEEEKLRKIRAKDERERKKKERAEMKKRKGPARKKKTAAGALLGMCVHVS